MLIVHLLRLRSSLQAQSFEGFAKQRYLSALNTQPTRVGQVSSTRLLRRRKTQGNDPVNYDREFLLLVEWTGLGWDRLPQIDDPAEEGAFKAYDIEVEFIGCFESIGDLQEE